MTGNAQLSGAFGGSWVRMVVGAARALPLRPPAHGGHCLGDEALGRTQIFTSCSENLRCLCRNNAQRTSRNREAACSFTLTWWCPWGAIEKGRRHRDPTQGALTAEAGDLPASRREQAELHQLLKLPTTRQSPVRYKRGYNHGCAMWEMGIEAQTI